MINKDNNSTTYYTHGFHPYPAKFTPQIVNKYFNLYCQQGFRILDPFCGSGTTLVEGILNNMHSVGIDLNPIAYIISRAKSSKYSLEELSDLQNFILEFQLKFSDGLFSKKYFYNNTITIPDFPNRKHWFQENVAYELAVLRRIIDEIKNEKTRMLLYCAFSKIIVKVSNQDSEVRYTAKIKNHPDGIVFSLFSETVLNYLKILSSTDYKVTSDAEVYNGDSLEILKSFPDDTFDFIITSPPYINTFDYYLYHKLRMFWLGYNHIPVRQKEIGNHHRIDTKNFKLAKAEYIDSMSNIINEISRVAKPMSFFIIIIGDGIVEKKTIDMSKVISDICMNSNYVIEKIESVNLSDITRSFNKKFSNAPKKEHSITLINKK